MSTFIERFTEKKNPVKQSADRNIRRYIASQDRRVIL